jgi:hypothetical protein
MPLRDFTKIWWAIYIRIGIDARQRTIEGAVQNEERPNDLPWVFQLPEGRLFPKSKSLNS